MPTVLGRKLDLDDGMVTVIHGGCPAETGLARWTDGVVPVAINWEMLGVNAGPLAGLPVRVKARRPQEIHAVALLTPDERVGVQEASIHDVYAGEHASLLQRGVALGGRRTIGCRAGGGFDVRDQVRPIILSRFGHMPLRAHPLRGVLAGIMGVEVIGRAEAPRRRGDVIRLALAQLRAVPPVVLHPHAAPHGDGGHLVQPRRGI